jgi:hypothetical protein
MPPPTHYRYGMRIVLFSGIDGKNNTVHICCRDLVGGGMPPPYKHKVFVKNTSNFEFYCQ